MLILCLELKDAFIAPTKKHLPTLLPNQLDDLVRRIYGASIRFDLSPDIRAMTTMSLCEL